MQPYQFAVNALLRLKPPVRELVEDADQDLDAFLARARAEGR